MDEQIIINQCRSRINTADLLVARGKRELARQEIEELRELLNLHNADRLPAAEKETGQVGPPEQP